MNPITGTVGIPWYNFLIFNSARAAALSGVADNVTTLQAQVALLQGQVTILQGQVSTLQSQVATLQGDVTALQAQVATLNAEIATIQGQIATIQSQIAALQAEDVHLQNEIDKINDIFAVHTVTTLPTPVAGLKTNVSDALAPAFGVAVAGGGTVFTPVYSDGTTWFVG
jgi:peptidoglycan hydrolase CwlO-like protein